MPKYYQVITELPLHRFIDCAVDNNLYALIIEGKPDEKELIAAWDAIRIQYADAVKDFEYRMILSLQREIYRLELILAQVEMLIEMLRKFFVQQYVVEVNRMLSSSFKFDVNDYQEYERDLKGAWSRSRGIKISLDLKLLAFEKMLTKYTSKNQKPTREYFQGILITLSDYAHYPIHETITTWEFCERIRRVTDYVEREKMMNAKMKLKK